MTAGDPTVIGQLSVASSQLSTDNGQPTTDRPVADLPVQIQVNGVIVGTTLTDSQGNFSYTPSGLVVGTSATIEARAVTTDALGNTVAGAWSSAVTFTLTSSDTGASVSQLQLVDSSGAPITSLLTTSPIVSGQITSTGDLSGVTVELDTNGDGQPDLTTTADSSGQFKFQPANLPEGVVAVSARTSITADNGTTATSAWTSLKFVYTTDASDPQMQALAAALVAQADSASGSETDYESSQTAAASSLQQTLASSQGDQTSGDAGAATTYNSSAGAADATFAGQASAAESNFAAAIQSYSGDATSYSVNDLAWPSPPPAAQTPDDPRPAPPAEQPAQPGPTFEVTQDPGYQSTVATAEGIHDQAVQKATGDYQTAVAQANGVYDASLMAAASQEEQTLTALATVTGTNPYDVAAAAALYNQTIGSLQTDASNKIDSYNDIYHGDVKAALAAEAATFASDAAADFVTMKALGDAWRKVYNFVAPSGWDDPLNTIEWIEMYYAPLFSHWADLLLGDEQADMAWATGDAAAVEQLAEATAKASAWRTEEIAKAGYQENTGDAAAQYDLSQTTAEAAFWNATTAANVTYSNALLTDQAREGFAVAQAKARQQLNDSLAKAARDRTYANADAEATLTQSIATAAATATAAWATEEGTSWAQYQASLAANKQQYADQDAPQYDLLLHSEADADYAKAQALDKAGEQQDEADASATQSLADATAKAARDRALGYALATETAAIGDATAVLTKYDAIASANQSLTLTCAGPDKDNTIAAAQAALTLVQEEWQDQLNQLIAEIAKHVNGHEDVAPGIPFAPTAAELQAYGTAIAKAQNERDHAEDPAYLAQETAVTNAATTYDAALRDAAATLSQTMTALDSAYLRRHRPGPA